MGDIEWASSLTDSLNTPYARQVTRAMTATKTARPNTSRLARTHRGRVT